AGGDELARHAVAAVDHERLAVDHHHVGRIGAPAGDARPALGAEQDQPGGIGHCSGCPQSAVKPNSFTATAQRSESAFCTAASSAAVVPVGSSPNACSRLPTSGSRTAAAMAALSRSIVAAGVAASANAPYQLVPSMS